MNRNMRIAKELLKLAKSIVAEDKVFEAERNLINEYIHFFKSDFEYDDENYHIEFKDKSEAQNELYADHSLEVTCKNGDYSGIEDFVNDNQSAFGHYFLKQLENNLNDEIGTSTIVEYENALMEDEGISEEEASDWATEKLCSFMMESNWGNGGPNSAKIYCDGQECGKFDFFNMLYNCSMRY